MLAIVFPGQGSQSIGMLRDLALLHPEVRATFETASQVLGYDLWQLCQEGPAETLNRTQTTQPALLAAGVAAWRVWRAQGGSLPAYLAGHSLGEYTALVCAEALDYAAAIALVAERGRLMQEAVPEGAGAMAAILGLEDAQVVAVCAEAAALGVVEAVNFNAPGQVVIAGVTAAVERAGELAKAAGAKRVLLLPVSVPSHCALLKPAAERLAAYLAQVNVRAPQIPVLHNVDARARVSPDEIRAALAEQLYRPVRWVQIIQTMAQSGVTNLVECGPGKVLVGLNKRIAKEMDARALYDAATLAESLTMIEHPAHER